MTILSILSLFVFLVLSYFYAKIQFSTSLLLVSALSVCTFSGVIGSSGYLFYLFSLCNFVLFNRVRVGFNCIVIFSVFAVLLFPIVFLSLQNDADGVKNFLKYFQTLVLVFGLFFISKDCFSFSTKNISKLCKIFIFTNAFFGLLFHFLFDVYDFGLIRFSGIFFDSNYYALYCLVFYFALDVSGNKDIKTKALMFVFLVFSLSFSIIFLFFIYLILSNYILKLFQNRVSFLLFVIAAMGGYLFVMYYLEELAGSNAYSNQFILYKVNSLTHRLAAQFQALDILVEKDAFFTGLGSGRNMELTGRALHHSFLQMIFSHGVFYFLLMVFILAFSISSLGVDLACNRKYYSMLYCLVIACFVLDPYATLYFNTVFLFYYLCGRKYYPGRM